MTPHLTPKSVPFPLPPQICNYHQQKNSGSLGLRKELGGAQSLPQSLLALSITGDTSTSPEATEKRCPPFMSPAVGSQVIWTMTEHRWVMERNPRPDKLSEDTAAEEMLLTHSAWEPPACETVRPQALE